MECAPLVPGVRYLVEPPLAWAEHRISFPVMRGRGTRRRAPELNLALSVPRLVGLRSPRDSHRRPPICLCCL